MPGRSRLAALCDQAAGESTSLPSLNRLLRSFISSVGSATEDNRRASQLLAFIRTKGTFKSDGMRVGIGVRKRAVLLSEITWNLEGEEIPAALRKAKIHLRQEDWEAAMRFLTLFLSALERQE